VGNLQGFYISGRNSRSKIDLKVDFGTGRLNLVTIFDFKELLHLFDDLNAWKQNRKDRKL